MGVPQRHAGVRRTFAPFVEEAFDSLSYEDQETFERLLTSDDPDLFAWIMGHQKCDDPELAAMVATIVNRVKV